MKINKVEHKKKFVRRSKEFHSLLAIFLRFSTGLKWMVGIGQTICMGLASTKQELSLSQPAPSKYKPLTKTPSWRGQRDRYGRP